MKTREQLTKSFPVSSRRSSLRVEPDTMRKLFGREKAQFVCAWSLLAAADLSEVTESEREDLVLESCCQRKFFML